MTGEAVAERRKRERLSPTFRCLARLNMRWTGEPPRPGHFLRAEGARARTAYEIVHMTEKSRPEAPVRRFILWCERHPASDIPEGATLHAFRWDPRGARKRRARP